MLPLKAELVLPLCINQHLNEAEEKEQKSECKKGEDKHHENAYFSAVTSEEDKSFHTQA